MYTPQDLILWNRNFKNNHKSTIRSSVLSVQFPDPWSLGFQKQIIWHIQIRTSVSYIWRGKPGIQQPAGCMAAWQGCMWQPCLKKEPDSFSELIFLTWSLLVICLVLLSNIPFYHQEPVPSPIPEIWFPPAWHEVVQEAPLSIKVPSKQLEVLRLQTAEIGRTIRG